MKNKHDADCLRRKRDFPYLCTCALDDETLAEFEAGRVRSVSASDSAAAGGHKEAAA